MDFYTQISVISRPALLICKITFYKTFMGAEEIIPQINAAAGIL
jgi:hypothetical protein